MKRTLKIPTGNISKEDLEIKVKGLMKPMSKRQLQIKLAKIQHTQPEKNWDKSVLDFFRK